MHATDLLFPRPRTCSTEADTFVLPNRLTLSGERVPTWLADRLARACERAGSALVETGGAAVTLRKGNVTVAGVSDPSLLEQAYELNISSEGGIALIGGSAAGLRHGLITLSLLIEAAAGGAELSPLRIIDVPAFRVRGVQMDLAREFFPRADYLKKMLDRLADLKVNTLWLYIENHLRAPGLEDLSQKAGMTPEEAREVSAYGEARGIDVVPGTNVLSHMDGWFRLERYAHFSDGLLRSYPVLTRPETWELVEKYLDALLDAFPSKNFHAGLDELLFTGTNPEAQAAIDEQGKPKYFTDFALKVIDYLKARGKTVWIWDDMVMGKNVYRKEGFNDDYHASLDRIPHDVVMTHWWYWTDTDDRPHGPTLKRVVDAGRPFVVAPSSRSSGYTYPALDLITDNQSYMAGCGLKHGAFGYINTHWESRYGTSFESAWPCLAVGMAYAWQGPAETDEDLLRRLGFVMTGETDGSLGKLLRVLTRVNHFLEVEKGLGRAGLRKILLLNGPHQVWRRISGLLDGTDRRNLRQWLDEATAHQQALGHRDAQLAASLRMPIALYRTCLEVIEAFDQAWHCYHEAALIEREPAQRADFHQHLSQSIGHVNRAAEQVRQLQRHFIELEATGHTPYDSHALGAWAGELGRVTQLISDVAFDGGGLPYFEKLLYLSDAYHISNLRHIQVQNTFHDRYHGQPWMQLESEKQRDGRPRVEPA